MKISINIVLPGESNNAMDDVDDVLVKKELIYIIVFAMVFVVNYAFYLLSTNPVRLSSLYLGTLPSIIIDPFQHTNGTLLSPEGQDIRWRDFVQYYCLYQSRLSRTSFNRYVIYSSTYSGLANKINGLVSSLLIAMVTDRGLKRFIVVRVSPLVADWPSFDSYFNLPLEGHHLDDSGTLFE